MGKASFDHRLKIFSETLNELFTGLHTALILRSAEDMVNVIYSKINQVPDPRFEPSNLTHEQRERSTLYKQPQPPP